MVADEDGGAGRAEDVVRVVDDKLNARGIAHGEDKGAAAGPLGNLALADEGEHDGDEDAVEGAGEERDVGGEDAGDEAGLGDDEGRHVEGQCEGSVAEEEFGEVFEEEDHLFWYPLRRLVRSCRYIREESRRVG